MLRIFLTVSLVFVCFVTTVRFLSLSTFFEHQADTPIHSPSQTKAHASNQPIANEQAELAEREAKSHDSAADNDVVSNVSSNVGSNVSNNISNNISHNSATPSRSDTASYLEYQAKQTRKLVQIYTQTMLRIPQLEKTIQNATHVNTGASEEVKKANAALEKLYKLKQQLSEEHPELLALITN